MTCINWKVFKIYLGTTCLGHTVHSWIEWRLSVKGKFAKVNFLPITRISNVNELM